MSNRPELWALKMNVVPHLMTYQTAEFTQNPILGNGAQLSKVLNLSVKTEDTFKGGRTHFLPTVPTDAAGSAHGYNCMRPDGWTDNRSSYQKTSWNTLVKSTFLNLLVEVLQSSVFPCQSAHSSSGVSSE